MVPDGRAGPGRRRERAFPRGNHGRVAVEARKPVPGLLVALGQRNPASRRRTRGIHLLQRPDERREVARRLDRVDLPDRHRDALDPGVDLPEPGVAATRVTQRDRHGKLDREQRRQSRKPVELLAIRLRRPLAARKPHRELVAEPKDRVDGAAGLDPMQRQVGPLGELLLEQPAHERLVELELVAVHPRGHSSCHGSRIRRPTGSTTATAGSGIASHSARSTRFRPRSQAR